MYDDEAQNYNNFTAIYAMVQYDDVGKNHCLSSIKWKLIFRIAELLLQCKPFIYHYYDYSKNADMHISFSISAAKTQWTC